MYTECPECRTAFRLTAKILRQAHGRVRCGGCGNTFNAIDHLAEEAGGEEPGYSTTAHIFDERSKELLESLDQLTGPDAVRIEDTGVEWRVLDVDADKGEASLDAGNDAAPDSSPTGTIQWSLEEAEDAETTAGEAAADAARNADDADDIAAPWPDNEPEIEIRTVTGTPAGEDVGEAGGQTANWQLEDVSNLGEEDDPGQAEAADDNLNDTHDEAVTTSLPARGAKPAADSGALIELADSQPVDNDAAAIAAESPAAAAASETDTPASDAAQGLAANEAGHADEVRYDDNTPLPDENFRPYDEFLKTRPDDEPAAPDSAKPTATPTPVAAAAALADPQADLELGEEDDWQDLLAEVASEDAPADTAADDLADVDDNVREETDDVTGLGAADDNEADIAATADPHPELLNADAEPASLPEQDTGDISLPSDDPAATTVARDDAVGDTVLQHPDDDADAAGSDADAPEVAIAADDTNAAAGGTDQASDEPAETSEAAEELQELADDDAADDPQQFPPPAADDELSVEMQIDQDLLRAVAENAEQPGNSAAAAGDSMLVETIIMEGDTITDLLSEAEVADADNELSGDEPDPEPSIISELEADTAARPTSSRVRGLGIAAGVLLSLVLAAQLVHANREALATYDSFNAAIGPLYEVLGQPVTPAWDVRGWQFESTSGSTDETGQRLTIRSRIANQSQQSMPLPLVYVSLTDRFEELVGSRVLRPVDYLEPGVRPGQKIAAGASFSAVINIDTPSPDATGFKLNVCYRAGAGQVRCAIEDFKN